VAGEGHDRFPCQRVELARVSLTGLTGMGGGRPRVGSIILVGRRLDSGRAFASLDAHGRPLWTGAGEISTAFSSPFLLSGGS